MINTKTKIINRYHKIYMISNINNYHPPFESIYSWINLTVGRKEKVELSIVFVTKEQSKTLNKKYRGNNKPTDILSFASSIPIFLQKTHKNLGELIISSEIVNKTAQLHNIKVTAHWAHIIIHGLLHLLGYNHNNNKSRIPMENQEILLLKELGFKNPYN